MRGWDNPEGSPILGTRPGGGVASMGSTRTNTKRWPVNGLQAQQRGGIVLEQAHSLPVAMQRRERAVGGLAHDVFVVDPPSGAVVTNLAPGGCS